MAEPARKYEPDPSLNQDPFNPVPPRLTDPVGPGPAVNDRGDASYSDRPVIENRVRSGGSGVLIAAVIVILAAVAFYIFGPGATSRPAGDTAAPPATTTESAPATTIVPDDSGTATQPNATAPAAPAEQPAAPKAAAPAEQAPATQPAPTTAPAQ